MTTTSGTRGTQAVLAGLVFLAMCFTTTVAVSRPALSRELAASVDGSPATHLLRRQMDALQAEELQEFIRHQRQIKFKSSYRELPEVIRKAEERNRAGKSLTKSVQVIPDELASRESTALKDLPSSSKVYFPTEVDDSKYNAVVKHFGKSVSSSQRNPFRFRTKSPPRINFKKRGRFIKKKMVGKKLIRTVTPEPKRVEQNPIEFETSSTENIENKIKNKTSRKNSFRSSRIRNIGKAVPKIKNGGPNPDEPFKNPFYIETPPSEISSYSFVPDSSRASISTKSQAKKPRQSTVPTPSKLTRTGTNTSFHIITQRKQKNNKHKDNHSGKITRARFMNEKRKRLQTIMNRRKNAGLQIVTKQPKTHSINNWNHFLTQKHNSVEILNRTPIQKSKDISHKLVSNHLQSQNNGKHKTSPRRGKSLSTARVTQSVLKVAHKKTSFPNFVNMRSTKFDCGNFKGGEYFADVDTKCQVFHVCYGGRQASFACPVGTAFSQQLLVCDWRNKVQCGASRLRSVVQHAREHALDNGI